MLAQLLALSLAAAPFPLPSVDGKALAVKADQKVFRLPMRFEKVRAFYEERYGAGKAKDVKLVLSGVPGSRTLALSSKRVGDEWTRATVKEGEGETVVEVTRVLRMKDTDITGNGRPLVEFIFTRSPEVEKAVKEIDHTEQMRR